MKIMKGKKAFLWKTVAALVILALFAVPVFASFPTYAWTGASVPTGAAPPSGGGAGAGAGTSSAADAPAAEAPVVDAPVVDAPTADAPAVDAPVVDTPVVDTPVVDAPAVDAPAVTSNASDYAATQTPIITVSYLAPNTETTVTITAPDGTVTDMVATTDANGNATITYAPEGGLLKGEYNIVATDGATTVTSLFTDAVAYSSQHWANIPGEWTGGALNKQNAAYYEGNTVPILVTITDFTTTSVITITYDYSRSNKGGYDFINDFNASNANPDVSGLSGTVDSSSPFTGYNATIIGWTPPQEHTVGNNTERSFDLTIAPIDTSITVAWVLFGGHLAQANTAPNDPLTGNTVGPWGNNQGASDISGGPIHINAGKELPLNPGGIYAYSDLQLVKSGPEFAHIGDVITYTYQVYNAGTRNYNTVSITDDKATVPSTPYSKTGGNVDTILQQGETWTYESNNYTVTEGAVTTDVSGNKVLVNTATVNATYHPVDHPNQTRTDSATSTWTVDVLYPSIGVTKDGAQYAHEGDLVHYTVEVTNTSSDGTLLSNIAVGDDPAGTLTLTSGDTNNNGILDPGETWVYEYDYTIPASGNDLFNNEVTASGEDAIEGTADDTANWSVDVLHPSIGVTKDGPDTATVGDTIEFTIVVDNTGDTPLNLVNWLEGLPVTIVGLTGDDGNDGVLGVDETWTLTVSYVVQAGDAPSLTNTVDVSAFDLLDMQVMADDFWTLSVTAVIPAPAAGPPPSECPETLVIDLMGTVAGYPVKTDCTLCEDVSMTSPDGSFVLNIPQGTQVLNSDDTFAYTNPIVGTFAGTPAAPSGATIVRAYQLSPNGIVFKNHNATLAAKYNPADVPQGSSLIWAYYDDSAGQWINMDTAGYVAGGVEVPDTLATTTAHLTYFAILAKTK